MLTLSLHLSLVQISSGKIFDSKNGKITTLNQRFGGWSAVGEKRKVGSTFDFRRLKI